MKPNRYLKNRPGIYGIRNLTNGKIYVGKTHCMYRRCSQYEYDFRKDRKNNLNPHLLNAMKKVGFENFEMFVLDFCKPDDLAKQELFWMEKLKATDRTYGYNLRADSSSGMLAHPETKALQSRNLKTQWANGIRSQHSEKLKDAWKNAEPQRLIEQAERFRKSKTKFKYLVVFPDGASEVCLYFRLKELRISGAVGNMSRSGLTQTTCNNHQIFRMSANNED